MSKFKIGDEATLKKKYPWFSKNGITAGTNPQFGKIYTVLELDRCGSSVYLTFSELHPDDGWDENAFEKVVSDRVLSKELETVPEPYCL